MKSRTGKALIAAAISLCVVTVLAFSFMSYVDHANYRTMTKAESNHCDQISISAFKTGAISSADLDWSVHMLQTPSWTNDTSETQRRHLEVMVAMKRLRVFAPGQKERLYQVTAPFLTSHNKYEPVGAMAVMRALKDKRAIPSVTALLNDRDDLTRQIAHKTLGVLENPGTDA